MNRERRAVIVFVSLALAVWTFYLFIMFGWLWVDRLPDGSNALVICPLRQVIDLCMYVTKGFKG